MAELESSQAGTPVPGSNEEVSKKRVAPDDAESKVAGQDEDSTAHEPVAKKLKADGDGDGEGDKASKKKSSKKKKDKSASSDSTKKTKKKKKKSSSKKRKKKSDKGGSTRDMLMEGEADESDDGDADGDSDDDSEEDAADEQNVYEKDGFVVDSDDEEGDEESDSDSASDSDDSSVGGGRLRRLKTADEAPDEDDFELLREADGAGAAGGAGDGGDDDDLDDDADDSDDSIDGWIVNDDGDQVDETPAERKKRRKMAKLKRQKAKKHQAVSGMTMEQSSEFHELFGFEGDRFDAGFDDEEDEMFPEEDEDAQEREEREKKAERAKALEAEMHARFEPDVLKKSYFTSVDDRIREVDVPERMQLQELSVLGTKRFLAGESALEVDTANSEAMHRQARWVVARLHTVFEEYDNLGILRDAFDKHDNDIFQNEAKLVVDVQAALVLMQRNKLEAPHIHIHMSEHVGGLSLFHLWAVHELGLKYQRYLARAKAVKKFVQSNVPDGEDLGDEGWIHGVFAASEALAERLHAHQQHNVASVAATSETSATAVVAPAAAGDDTTAASEATLPSANGTTVVPTQTRDPSATAADQVSQLSLTENATATATTEGADAGDVSVPAPPAESEAQQQTTASEPLPPVAPTSTALSTSTGGGGGGGGANYSSALLEPLRMSAREQVLKFLERLLDDDESTEVTLRELHEYLTLRYANALGKSKRKSKKKKSGSDLDDDDDDDDMDMDDDDDENENEGVTKAKVGGGLKRPTAKRSGGVNQRTVLSSETSQVCQMIGSATKLGANTEANRRLYDAPQQKDSRYSPGVMATLELSGGLNDEKLVLNAAADAVARQIALEPRVRQAVRTIVRRFGALSTTPTIKGMLEVASSPEHEMYPVVSLAGKPFSKFMDAPPRRPSPVGQDEEVSSSTVDYADYRDQILLILRARKQGLLEISINAADVEARIVELLLPKFLSATHCHTTRANQMELLPEWDALRCKTVARAAHAYLVPWAQRQLIHELRDMALKFVSAECAWALRKRISVAPFQLPMTLADAKNEDIPNTLAEDATVVAMVFSMERDSPGYMVAVDGAGVMIDSKKLPALNKRREWSAMIESFVSKKDCHAVVLSGCVGLRIRPVQMHLQRFCETRMAEWKERRRNGFPTRRRPRRDSSDEDDEDDDIEMYDEDNDRNPYFHTTIMDSQVATVFASGELAATMYPDMDFNLRKAISLAHTLQNPLLSTASLWSDVSVGTIRAKDSNILALNLHRSQKEVPPSMLLLELEKVFVNTTAYVGVDVNHAARHPHAATTVQFVPGLGPRKAAMILAKLKSERGWCFTRHALRRHYFAATEPRAGGKRRSGVNCVLRNCLGFLLCKNRVPDPEDTDTDDSFAALDATRIHPMQYQIAAMLAWMAKHGNKTDKESPGYKYSKGHLHGAHEKAVRSVIKSARAKLAERLLRDDPEPGDEWLMACVVRVYNDYFKGGLAHWDGAILSPEEDTLTLTDDLIATNLINVKEFIASIEALGVGGDDGVDAAVSDADDEEDLLSDEDRDEDDDDDDDDDEDAADRRAAKASRRVASIQRAPPIPSVMRRKDDVLWCINELRFASCERRLHFVEPSGDELFEILTGHTKESLEAGAVVTVTIKGVDQRWVQADFGGLRCSIHCNDLSDERVEIQDGRDLERYMNDTLRWRVGDPVRAQIKAINRANFRLNLCTKPSVVGTWTNRVRDTFWRVPQKPVKVPTVGVSDQLPGASSTPKSKAGAFKLRPIKHPFFHNIGHREAAEMLRAGPVGELVFRPSSSKGPSAISVSFKVGESPEWIQHLTVVEKGKRNPKDLALGSTLVLKNESYEDLDEISARYFSPIAEFLGDMYSHKNYVAGSRNDVANILRAEKAQNSARIPYYFARHEVSPGYFRLMYLPGTRTVQNVVIAVTPDGFKITDRHFTSLNQLIGWFKQNYQTLAQTVHQHKQQQQQQHGYPQQQQMMQHSQYGMAAAAGGAGGGYGGRYAMPQTTGAYMPPGGGQPGVAAYDMGGSYGGDRDGGRYRDGDRYRGDSRRDDDRYRSSRDGERGGGRGGYGY